MGDTEEFATEPVPAAHQVGWLRVALVSAMVAFSLPTFITGAEVFLATDNRTALAAVVTGGALLTLIAALCGVIGTRTHLSSYMLARIAFGIRGAAAVNLAFALSLLGWFGVNVDLFSGAVLRLLETLFAVQAAPWVVELAAGAVMTATTLYGFSAINRLSLLLVPVLMVVTALLLAEALGSQGSSAPFGVTQDQQVTFGFAVSSVVGGVIVGAVILPDITRFIRSWPGAIGTALLAYLVVESVVMVAGGLAADALSNDDLLDVLIVLGLGWGAFAIVIAGSWVLNSLNLYSAALSVQATSRRVEETALVIGLGVLGTLAAFANILEYFLTFLFYLAIVFVPVAGVIAVDHFFARPWAYRADFATHSRLYSPAALLAWALGSAVALLGSEGLLRLTGMAALDAMLSAALCYALLSRAARRTAG